MIQLNKKYFEIDQFGNFVHLGVIATLVDMAMPILNHREFLYSRYNKMPKPDGDLTAPLERYITNIAAGYAGGKPPRFTVTTEENDAMKRAANDLFNKTYDPRLASIDAYKLIVDYINDYNDLPLFFYQTVKSYCMLGAAYARLYENDENEIVFAPLSALQTIAIYDYSTPAQKIALFRIWNEFNENMQPITVCELTTHDYKKVFVNTVEMPNNYLEREEDADDLHWKLCPFMAMESPDGKAIFEPVIGLIDAYETVLTNAKHTFEYNDNDGCKLMIVGYAPQNPLMIEQNGKLVQNPDRVEEDKLILEAPTFYTDENGKVEWITKNINDTAVENHKKTLINDIFTLSAVPDLSGALVEKTATEIERSFFPLEQYLIEADRIFYKEFIELWENITARINLKKHTEFDFRDIKIEFVRNMPTDKASSVNSAVLLQNLLSRETLLKLLPFDIDVSNELAKDPAGKVEEIEVSSPGIGANQNGNQYSGANVTASETKTLLRGEIDEAQEAL